MVAPPSSLLLWRSVCLRLRHQYRLKLVDDVCYVSGQSQHRSFVSKNGTSINRTQSGEREKSSYIHGQGSIPLIGATIGQLMEQAANDRPHKEAFVVSHQRIRLTFEELLLQSDKLAAGLMTLGVKRGDRVGICATNCVEWLLVQYGTARAGIIMVNINPAYQAPELEFTLRKVGVKVLIMTERYKTQDYYSMMLKICPELENISSQRIVSKSLPDLERLIIIGNEHFRGTLTFSDVMELSTTENRRSVVDLQKTLQFDDPINIQFTSGTTGQPKGALLTHHGIINNARFVGNRMDYHCKETRICAPVPLYHCFGMVMASLQVLAWGATCVLPSPSFEPETTLQAVQQEQCTSLYGTPTMFIDMLHLSNFNEFDLKTLYTGVMAGSPCPTEVMKKVISRMNMKHVTICYGTTENSPVTFQSMMDDPIEKRVSTVGKPHPFVEAKIIDEQGSIVPRGVKGELCIRSYGVMLGYWNDPEATKRVICSDRWYRTGDIAVLFDDDHLQIVGRIKDMIIRGGENIYPVEVEQFLHKHPKIADAQVIGVPDERLGEQVAAWIRLKEGQTATKQDIIDFCKGQLAHFKVPYYVSFVDSYPLTVSGKVQKFKMREIAMEMYSLKE